MLAPLITDQSQTFQLPPSPPTEDAVGDAVSTPLDFRAEAEADVSISAPLAPSFQSPSSTTSQPKKRRVRRRQIDLLKGTHSVILQN